MSWDASGFDKPLILLKFQDSSEAAEKHLYKPTEEVEEFFKDKPNSEEYIHRLRKNEKLKDACDFLANAINGRVGVWWACLCVENLKKELEEAKKGLSKEDIKKQEKEERRAKMAEAAADRDAAKQKSEMLKAGLAQAEEAIKKGFQEGSTAFKLPGSSKELSQFIAEHDKMMSQLSPEAKIEIQASMEQTKLNFQEKYGKTIPEAVQEVIRGSVTTPPGIAEKSNYSKAQTAKLQAQVDAIKKKMAEKMSIFPLKIPGLPGKTSPKNAGDAYEAAIRWVITPTHTNSILAAEAGKNAAKTPEGMLAFSAFWGGTNLSEDERVIVKPPPGLSAKGVASTIFMCAMAKGGSKSYDDRYKDYFALGVEAAQGTLTWEDRIEKNPEMINNDRNWEGKPGFGRR